MPSTRTASAVASMPTPSILSLRHDLRAQHPVFGENWRKLADHEHLQAGDQTACVSMLLSLHGGRWMEVEEEFSHCIGKTVREACSDENDEDGHERVFRRSVHVC